MKRLMEAMVRVGLVTAWRLAGAPTKRVWSSWNATTEGVVRDPSRFVMTTGSPPSMTATTEFVVPRSIPMILLLLMVFRPPASFAKEPRIDWTVYNPRANARLGA